MAEAVDRLGAGIRVKALIVFDAFINRRFPYPGRLAPATKALIVFDAFFNPSMAR